MGSIPAKKNENLLQKLQNNGTVPRGLLPPLKRHKQSQSARLESLLHNAWLPNPFRTRITGLTWPCC